MEGGRRSSGSGHSAVLKLKPRVLVRSTGRYLVPFVSENIFKNLSKLGILSPKKIEGVPLIAIAIVWNY